MDYDAIAVTAEGLLVEYGQAMTLTRQTSGTFGAASGGYTGAVDTTYSVTGLVQAPQGSGDRYFVGTTIQAGDRFVILAANDMTVTPQAGDKLTIGSVVYLVVASTPISPGGTDLLYRVLVRK